MPKGPRIAVIALVGAAAVAVALLVATTGGDRAVEDDSSELSLRIPDSWHEREPTNRGLEVYTGRASVDDPDCVGVEETARVTVDERTLPDRETISRPERFGARLGTTYEFGSTDERRQLAEIQCDEIWQLIQFSEKGRT